MVTLTVHPETEQETQTTPQAQGTQLQIHWDLTPGEQYAYSTAEWIAKHKSTFQALMSFMHKQVDAGNPCTTRDDVLAWAREGGLEMSAVADVKRDHNLYAGLTRYMVMLRPRLARTISFRKSKMDPVDMVAVWHECVNAGTFFLARDRKEAQRMVELNDAAAR